jgi:hypothetical protein
LSADNLSVSGSDRTLGAGRRPRMYSETMYSESSPVSDISDITNTTSTAGPRMQIAFKSPSTLPAQGWSLDMLHTQSFRGLPVHVRQKKSPVSCEIERDIAYQHTERRLMNSGRFVERRGYWLFLREIAVVPRAYLLPVASRMAGLKKRCWEHPSLPAAIRKIEKRSTETRRASICSTREHVSPRNLF